MQTEKQRQELTVSELSAHLVTLSINQDHVAQGWIKFLISIEGALAVGFEAVARIGPSSNESSYELSSPLSAIIPMLGIIVAVAITWIIVRERKWQAWYVQQFNNLPGNRARVFPDERRVIGAVKVNRISQIIVCVSAAIVLAWLGMLLWGGK